MPGVVTLPDPRDTEPSLGRDLIPVQLALIAHDDDLKRADATHGEFLPARRAMAGGVLGHAVQVTGYSRSPIIRLTSAWSIRSARPSHRVYLVYAPLFDNPVFAAISPHDSPANSRSMATSSAVTSGLCEWGMCPHIGQGLPF
jgi:hypothetical protein